MTVKALIDRLQNYPPDLLVITQGSDYYGCNNVDLVCTVVYETAQIGSDKLIRTGFPVPQTPHSEIAVYLTNRV